MTETNNGTNLDQETIMRMFNRNRTEAIRIAHGNGHYDEKFQKITKLVDEEYAAAVLSTVSKEQ